MEPKTTGRILSTTEASLQLIETLVQQGGATATELTEELDLAHSTIHNHLNTLLQYGYVVREGTTYNIGAKFCHIGDYVRRRKPEYLIAGDIVAQLGQATKLEADFAVEENGHVISLHNELNFSDESHFLTDGRFFHVHSTASGKAMLAEYPRSRVERIIDQWGLPKQTEQTISSEEELFAELERVREQGYATSDEEAIDGLWAISKVVKTPMDDVCGSLNLSAPTYLHDNEIRHSAIETLNEQVDAFEERIEAHFADRYGSADE
ncbi:transcriptional regulator, IclR family [Halogranum amylolyticum]|uniref:Transcriptional regulator, IclR family n=1 Tax=Halogranum amylolyticum TaxID=660520 RepID=A0A1H8V6B5_9EURY|nr:IclR family transcriptional regulator C-terminal domain-containing protein [Halogranum amylolyticum]SEP11012.1 transcriptional regulator, IclR family [Halogranum amylolyticum]